MSEGIAGLDTLVGELDYPMFIVTATDGARRAGCLVGFVTQCSISPLRFLTCLSVQNYTFAVAQHTDTVAVHVLSQHDAELAALFGTRTGFEVDKFARCAWQDGPGGVPVLDDCANWFIARVLQRHTLGDHVGLLLEPTAASHQGFDHQLGFQDVHNLQAANDA
jgi:flavin reductase (DIM6/NTAB) family NADH-FMN oxidoreductase RutF